MEQKKEFVFNYIKTKNKLNNDQQEVINKIINKLADYHLEDMEYMFKSNVIFIVSMNIDFTEFEQDIKKFFKVGNVGACNFDNEPIMSEQYVFSVLKKVKLKSYEYYRKYDGEDAYIISLKD